VPGHEWADVLPSIIDGTAPVPVGPGHPETKQEPDLTPIPVWTGGGGETTTVFAAAFQEGDIESLT
jgi:hypothetical protein